MIAYLVLHYGGQTSTGMLYSAVLAGALAFLLSPAAPRDLLWLMQSSVMVNVAVARVSLCTHSESLILYMIADTLRFPTMVSDCKGFYGNLCEIL